MWMWTLLIEKYKLVTVDCLVVYKSMASISIKSLMTWIIDDIDKYTTWKLINEKVYIYIFVFWHTIKISCLYYSSFKLRVSDLDGKDYVCHVAPLNGQIVVDKSYHKVRK